MVLSVVTHYSLLTYLNLVRLVEGLHRPDREPAHLGLEEERHHEEHRRQQAERDLGQGARPRAGGGQRRVAVGDLEMKHSISSFPLKCVFVSKLPGA